MELKIKFLYETTRTNGGTGICGKCYNKIP